MAYNNSYNNSLYIEKTWVLSLETMAIVIDVSKIGNSYNLHCFNISYDCCIVPIVSFIPGFHKRIQMCQPNIVYNCNTILICNMNILFNTGQSFQDLFYIHLYFDLQILLPILPYGYE